jgi:hypothetical protein
MTASRLLSDGMAAAGTSHHAAVRLPLCRTGIGADRVFTAFHGCMPRGSSSVRR